MTWDDTSMTYDPLSMLHAIHGPPGWGPVTFDTNGTKVVTFRWRATKLAWHMTRYLCLHAKIWMDPGTRIPVTIVRCKRYEWIISGYFRWPVTISCAKPNSTSDKIVFRVCEDSLTAMISSGACILNGYFSHLEWWPRIPVHTEWSIGIGAMCQRRITLLLAWGYPNSVGTDS
jgi:hypothetical protein